MTEPSLRIMAKTREEAVLLPFIDYLAWCHQYLRDAVARDPLVGILCGYEGSLVFLESIWARHYWFEKCKRGEAT